MRRWSNSGFTLLEAVLTSGILVVLLAAAVPLWQADLRLWQRESEILAVRQEQRIVLEMVAREMRRARADSVEIAADDGTGQAALYFLTDDGVNQAKVSYLLEGTRLLRRKDNGDGVGTNVYLTGLSPHDGFLFAFVDRQNGTRRSEKGAHLQPYEAIELMLRCRQNNREYVKVTQVVPRN